MESGAEPGKTGFVWGEGVIPDIRRSRNGDSHEGSTGV